MTDEERLARRAELEEKFIDGLEPLEAGDPDWEELQLLNEVLGNPARDI